MALPIKYSDLIKIVQSNCYNVRDEYKSFTDEQLQETMVSDRLPYGVCILNVLGDLNTSGIIRSCSAFGAEEVLIVGRKALDKRGTVGQHNYLDIKKYACMKDETNVDSDAFFKIMEDHNYYPIALETGSVSIRNLKDVVSNYDGNKKPCLVFGSESLGIQKDILTKIEHVITIPMRGVLRSLNVASAASIMLYEMCNIMEN